MDANKQKTIGAAMMVPAAVLALYLIISVKFWVIAVLGVVFGVLAMVGYHMMKGASIKDAAQDVINDVTKKDDPK
jgi:uncharacterized membrane protein